MIRKFFITILLVASLVGVSFAVNLEGRPSADGTTTNWTPSSGTDNYAMVDDISLDNDNTNVGSSTLNDVDLYTFDNLDIPQDATIDSVVLICRCRRTTLICGLGGCTEIQLQVVHDSTYSSAGINCLLNSTPGGDENFHITHATYDTTADESWEPSDFDGQSVEYGFKLTNDDGTVQTLISKCGLTVGYTKASGDAVIEQATIEQATIVGD